MPSLVKISQTTLNSNPKLIGYATSRGKLVAKANKLGVLRLTPHGKRLGYSVFYGEIYESKAKHPAW